MLNSIELEDLNGILKPLADFSEADLCERQKWGDINFTEAKPEINSAIEIAEELLKLPLENLSTGAFQNLERIVQSITKRLVEIDNFSLQLADPAGTCQQLCRNLREDSNQFESIAQPIIPYLRLKRGDFDASKTNFEARFADVDKFLREAASQTKAYLSEASAKELEHRERVDGFLKETEKQALAQQERTTTVLSQAEAAGARVGVAKFTQVFADEAKKLRWKSWVWLFVTASLGAATLWFAVYSYWNLSTSEVETVWQTAARMGSKGAILAVLFSGVVWCGRVYRAVLHQATINKHRALSLQTFEAFVAATKDPEVKDAILLAAANASFGNTTTGLVDQKGSEGFPVGLYEATRNLRKGE